MASAVTLVSGFFAIAGRACNRSVPVRVCGVLLLLSGEHLSFCVTMHKTLI